MYGGVAVLLLEEAMFIMLAGMKKYKGFSFLRIVIFPFAFVGMLVFWVDGFADVAMADGGAGSGGTGSGVFYASSYPISITEDEVDFLSAGDLLLTDFVDNSYAYFGEISDDALFYIENFYANHRLSGNASNSKFVIKSTGYITPNVYAAYTENGSTNGNNLVIHNGKFAKVFGGYSNTAMGESNNNTITLYDGIYNDEIYAAKNKNGDIKNNTINIYGGNFFNNNIVAANSINGTSENNKVVLDGAINVQNNLKISASHTDGKSINNRVVLGPNFKLLGNSDKVILEGSSNMGRASNNTLEIYGKGLLVSGVSNFNNYYFVLPAIIKSGDTILSTVQGVNLNNANIGIALDSNAVLAVGDKITLFSNAYGQYNLVPINKQDLSLYYNIDIYVLDIKETALTKSSSQTKYNVDISYDNTSLDLHVLEKENSPFSIPELKSESMLLFESRLSELSLLSNSSDNISELLQNIGTENVNTTKLESFGYMTGITGTQNLGFQIDYDELSLLSGLSFNANPYLTLGLFFEAGIGNYTTKDKNTIGIYEQTGDGTNYFTGGGLFVKYIFYHNYNKQAYVSSSLSIGSIFNNWVKDTEMDMAEFMDKFMADEYADNVLDTVNMGLTYDLHSRYYAGHLGLNYQHKLSRYFRYNLYTKYNYIVIPGQTIMIDEDEVAFDKMQSSRFSVGSKMYLKQNPEIEHYLGGSVIIEGNGVSGGRINNVELSLYTTDTHMPVVYPSMKGSTKVFEYGIIYTPTTSYWQTIFNLKSYTGKQRALSTSILARYFW